MTAARAFVYDDAEIDWTPLEQVVKAIPGDGRTLRVGDFMWMGAVDLDDGCRLHLYKHSATRRYLRLDSHGHAYAYTHADRDYRLHHSPADAMEELGLPAPITEPAIDPPLVSNVFGGGIVEL